MSLFAIGDLHLAISVKSKPMDIFSGWENYLQIMTKNWLGRVSADDTIVLAGDISWAMNIKDAYEDFKWIHEMPGKKIILKGNHDYWWGSRKKMEDTFLGWGFDSLNILHNNCFAYDNYAICGTRGWVNMPNEEADAKIMAREAGRLSASLDTAVSAGLEPLVFMHYPPVYGNSINYNILEVLFKYNVKKCWYGHLHGPAIKNALNGEYDGINFKLISGDFLQFCPLKIE